MLTTQEKTFLHQQVNELHTDVRELQKSLNQLDDQKRSLIQKKKAVVQQIISLINQNKGLKKERDELTGAVKDSKEKRNAFNFEINKKIEAAKKLQSEKKTTAQKHGINEDPSEIKKQIERMEYNLETEVVSFEKEKKVMKAINELKKKFEQAKKLSGIWAQSHELSKEIDTEKSKAEELHQELQKKAKQSQEKHELIIDNNKKIDELKKQEAELNKEIYEKQAKIDKINPPLNEKLKSLSQDKTKLDVEYHQQKETHVQKRKKRLSELQNEVEEKLRKGEKLTTEDILVMQSRD